MLQQKQCPSLARFPRPDSREFYSAHLGSQFSYSESAEGGWSLAQLAWRPLPFFPAAGHSGHRAALLAVTLVPSQLLQDLQLRREPVQLRLRVEPDRRRQVVPAFVSALLPERLLPAAPGQARAQGSPLEAAAWAADLQQHFSQPGQGGNSDA